MLELYLLLVFMIIGAIFAIESEDLLSSVVALAAVGLLLSISFLVLKAPDVAITQLVVELLSLIILIRATINRDLPFSKSGRWLLNTVIALAFICALLIVSARCLQDLPPFGHPIMRVASTYLSRGVTDTGATNIVSSIVLDYRAFDTLGEATVLFTAVLGVLALVRRVARKKEGSSTEGDDE
jgi:multisubunit Na+/H+ antiporter MnhB subunit